MDEVKLLPCVTKASLEFADGSTCGIDFADANSIDEALSKLRLAATGDSLVTDEVVERVATSLWTEVDKQTQGRWPINTGDDDLTGLVDDDLNFRELARAALAAMPTIPPQSLPQSLGAIPGSHPADQAPSGLGASRFDPERDV